MCTGAEPAAIAAAAAAAAGGAGAGAAGAGAAAEGAGVTGAALASALGSGGLEAGLLGSEMPAIGAAGTESLAASAPELLPMMETATESAPQEMLPMMQNYAPEMTKMTGDTLNTGPSLFSKISDAANMYGKAQTAMGGGKSNTSSTSNVARPPSMNQPVQNVAKTPFGGQGLMASDSAKKKILKRMGLLGGM